MSADVHSSVLHRVLNHTYTPMASRLLRVNILSPITGELPSPSHQVSSDRSYLVHSSIDARLDVVEGKRKLLIQFFVAKVDNTEFINAEDRFTYVRDALKTLNRMDFDKLIVSVSSPLYSSHCTSLTSLSLLHRKLDLRPVRSQLLSVSHKY